MDVDPIGYCINVDQIEDQITDQTAAILAPNILGNICDWPRIGELADKYGLIIIEDAADTQGATIDEKALVSLGASVRLIWTFSSLKNSPTAIDLLFGKLASITGITSCISRTVFKIISVGSIIPRTCSGKKTL